MGGAGNILVGGAGNILCDDYSKEEFLAWLDFYVEGRSKLSLMSPRASLHHLLRGNKVSAEWNIFKQALVKEKIEVVENQKLSMPPNL